MSWSIRSTTDPGRWLTCSGGIDFEADPRTTAMLGDLKLHRIPIHPGGPTKVGVKTGADLLVAAWVTIPHPEASGEAPIADAPPTLGGLLVY